MCCWLEGKKEEFKHFFAHDDGFDNTNKFNNHIEEMRNVRTYGANHEILAILAILERAIHVLSYDYKLPLVILHMKA